jgi:hypothetical protein
MRHRTGLPLPLLCFIKHSRFIPSFPGVIGQFLLGVFRAHLDSPRRVLWEFCHHWLGRLIIVATIPQILSGIDDDMEFSGRDNDMVMVAYVAWICVAAAVFVLLEIRRRSTELSDKARVDVGVAETYGVELGDKQTAAESKGLVTGV